VCSLKNKKKSPFWRFGRIFETIINDKNFHLQKKSKKKQKSRNIKRRQNKKEARNIKAVRFFAIFSLSCDVIHFYCVL